MIERSKNANVVTYQIRRDKHGNVDQGDPVDVYWLMEAEDGAREELRRIEHKAYGFSVRWQDDRRRFLLTLHAFPTREIEIFEHKGESAAYVDIDGAPARLQKIFIETDESSLLPKVKFVELFGTDKGSGLPVREKVVPD